MSGTPLVSNLKTCEWWVNEKGKGLCALGTTWPKGNSPIIYAHFKVGKAIKDGYRRYPNKPPRLDASKLLYLGQRLHADGFDRGPKKGYTWLNDLNGVWIYSVYWELGNFAEVTTYRHNLEKMIHDTVRARYAGHKNVLAYNKGMQFTSDPYASQEVWVSSYEILRQLAELGIF